MKVSDKSPWPCKLNESRKKLMILVDMQGTMLCAC